jgi:hypothetical protein
LIAARHWQPPSTLARVKVLTWLSSALKNFPEVKVTFLETLGRMKCYISNF